MKSVLAATAALTLLVACGNQATDGLALPLLQRAVPSLGPEPTETPGFSPADIAGNLDGYIIITIPELGPPVAARLIAANGDDTTWQAQVGFTAAFRDGMLVATRGLPQDLMGADVEAVRAAIRAGGGSVTRVQSYLDAQDQIVSLTYDCTIRPDGTELVDLGLRQVTLRKLVETCESPAIIFENLYYLDDAGRILSSRQYVSRTVAYLRSNRL
jgi:hypothetical protein